MSQVKITTDSEAIEVLQEVLAYLRQREHFESGKSSLGFSHLYGEFGGQVKAADEQEG